MTRALAAMQAFWVCAFVVIAAHIALTGALNITAGPGVAPW